MADRIKFTDATVKALKPTGKWPRETYDAALPGFGVRTMPSGIKTWLLTYQRPGETRRTKVSLGNVETLTLAKARQKAMKLKVQLEAGTDPAEVRREERREKKTARLTFGWLAEGYIKRECPKLRRGSEVESIIRRELLPHWKHRRTDSLRKRDVRDRTKALIDDGKPAAAHRLNEVAKRLFAYAEEEGELDLNPMLGLKAPTKKEPRQRILSHDELKALWIASSELGYPFGPMYQLLMLSGQRREEVAGLQRSELDLDAMKLTLPPERNKSKRTHIVPLSPAAVELLAEQPEWTEGDYVFTTTAGARPVSGFSKAKARLDEESGVTDWRVHDIRRTVRTELARLGVVDLVAERVINHGPRGLAAVYDQYGYLDEKRAALNLWAAELRRIIEPEPDNVIELPQQESVG
jgi:integrase